MAPRFPLYIDLKDNNCTIFGGGNKAAVRAAILLQFEAKVTVISPTLCSKLREMDKEGLIRYIPRRYYRGDCSSSYLCVAATDNDAINISISDECKAKAIAVNVTNPPEFGTFSFPAVISEQDVTISAVCGANHGYAQRICEKIAGELPCFIEAARLEDGDE